MTPAQELRAAYIEWMRVNRPEKYAAMVKSATSETAASGSESIHEQELERMPA